MKKILGCLLIGLVLTGGVFCVQNYYAKADIQKSLNFNKRTYVKASHILVSSKAEAEKLKKEIENGEITFEDAAKKYSTCPSGKNGGDLGYLGRNMMVKEFEDAAFTLPLGKVSDPVKTQFGYHLIKVTGAQ